MADLSKLTGFAVLDAAGPQLSKLTGYAVLDGGMSLSKLAGYAVLAPVVAQATTPCLSINT